MSSTKGFLEFGSKLNKMKAQAKKENLAAIIKHLMLLHSDTVRKMQQGERSGKTYKKGQNRYHQASAPGEFPKTDRGQLVSSLFYETDVRGDKVEGKFGSKAAHGKHLEYKPAAHGGRPWLKPQFDLFAPKLRDALLNINRKYLNK